MRNYIEQNKSELNIPNEAKITEINVTSYISEFKGIEYSKASLIIDKTFDSKGAIINNPYNFWAIGFFDKRNTVSIPDIDSYEDLESTALYINNICNPYIVSTVADLLDTNFYYLKKVAYNHLSRFLYNLPQTINEKNFKMTYKPKSKNNINGINNLTPVSSVFYFDIDKYIKNGNILDGSFNNDFHISHSINSFKYFTNSHANSAVANDTVIRLNANKNIEYKNIINSIISDLSNPFYYVEKIDYKETNNRFIIEYMSYIPYTATLTPKLVGAKNDILYFDVLTDKYYLSDNEIANKPKKFRLEVYGYKTGDTSIEPPVFVPSKPDETINTIDSNSGLVEKSSLDWWIYAAIGGGILLIVIAIIIIVISNKKKKQKKQVKQNIRTQQVVRTNDSNIKTITTSRTIPTKSSSPTFRNPPPTSKKR